MKTKIIAAVVIFLTAVGAFCGRKYYTTTYLPQKRLDDAVKKQDEIIAGLRPRVRALAADTGDTPADPLAYCENVNDDIVGWITIPEDRKSVV